MSDQDFSALRTRFARNIYGTRKGAIRLALLQDYFSTQLLPELGPGPLRVLDAGCGLAQLSRPLLAAGHSVVFCDLAESMLSETEQQLDAGERERARFVHGPLQSLLPGQAQQFDLVLAHAVVEWTLEPQAAIEHLAALCRPGGTLSLSFYNRDALVFRNLIRGNWKKVRAAEQGGDPGGLTPTHPLHLGEVLAWLGAAGLAVEDTMGLRTFFDYLPRPLQEERSLEDILDLERHYARVSPYREMARYLHIRARRADDRQLPEAGRGG